MISAILWATLLLPQSGATDSRWSPWLGCFRLIGDELRRPAIPDELADEDEEGEDAALRSATARVCLTPEADGVRVRTLADGEPFLEEMLVADGARYPVDQGACSGWQRSDWSTDGERLYTVSELTCEEGRKRRVSGISLFVGSTWIEIQSVGSDRIGSVQVRRYRPVGEDETMELSGLPMETLQQATRARLGLNAQLSTGDVIEAVRATDSAAVEAAVMEGRSRFALDAATLGELDDAGVSPELIDLMVALSYPEKFVVDREQDRGGGGGYGYVPGYYGYDPYYDSPFAYPYFYAPFGYYYWYAPYHPIYGVRPLPTPGASVGRVIAGSGYTFVDRRRPSGGGGGGRYAKPRDGSSGGSDSGGVGSSGGSSGTASPSGYSRGGASGRSAKPKKR